MVNRLFSYSSLSINLTGGRGCSFLKGEGLLPGPALPSRPTITSAHLQEVTLGHCRNHRAPLVHRKRTDRALKVILDMV